MFLLTQWPPLRVQACCFRQRLGISTSSAQCAHWAPSPQGEGLRKRSSSSYYVFLTVSHPPAPLAGGFSYLRLSCQTTTKQARQNLTNYTSIQNRKKTLQFAQASTIIHTKRRFLSFGTERPAKSLIGKGAACRIRSSVCLAGNRQGIFSCLCMAKEGFA